MTRVDLWVSTADKVLRGERLYIVYIVFFYFVFTLKVFEDVGEEDGVCLTEALGMREVLPV